MSLPERSVPFKSIRDEWSTYGLQSGSILKLKISLVSLYRDEANPPRNTAVFSTAIRLEPVPDDIGDTSPRALGPNDVRLPVEFTPISVVTNIYETDSRTLFLLVPVLRAVRRTELFSADGTRIYEFDHSSVVSPIALPQAPDAH